MANSPNSKKKLLALMKILTTYTDEKHPMTVKQIIAELKKYGIDAERKSIYMDINILCEFGMDIICERSKVNKYYVGIRDFELPELKLLVDAVQCSKFITPKKSKELIKKIERLTSIHEAKELHRDVIIDNRVKMINENIYYNVDTIHRAIRENKQISFNYFEFTVDKKMKLRRDGQKYFASPYALMWSEGNYYLVAYYERYQSISNFRVDRMLNIELIEEERYFPDEYKDFSVAKYSKKIFSMFSGKTQTVRLEFHNSLINAVIDKFGVDINICKNSEETFQIVIDIVPSETFFGWLFMFGDKVRIISPGTVIQKMEEMIKRVSKIYCNN